MGSRNSLLSLILLVVGLPILYFIGNFVFACFV